MEVSYSIPRVSPLLARFWLDVDPDPLLARILARFWLDVDLGALLARFFGSMSISVRCAGPRLGSCNNFVTPKLGFLQLKWMLAMASGLNLLNFQK